MQYFLAENGRQMGPFEVSELLRMGLRPQTLVWCETMTDWERADRVPELAPLFTRATPRDHEEARLRAERARPRQSPQPPPRYSPAPAYAHAHAVDPAAQSRGLKIVAGICAILLGGLGIHKFVLGYTTAGVIMLLVSICSCGIGWPVMKVIAIVEGILYLTRSDEEFHQTYVLSRREWF